MPAVRKVLNIVWLVVIVAAAVVGWRVFDRRADAGPFLDCTPGSVAPVSSWSSLGVDEWEGSPLVAEPVAEVPRALSAASGPDGLLVATKEGGVFVVVDGEATELWVEPDLTTSGDESGLLDVAIDPDDRWIWTSVTDGDGDLELRRRPIDGPTSNDYEVILTVEQPHEWHNGGDVEFGPDGHLYLSLGDGGPNNDPNGNGQDLDTLLGSIIRIEPTSDGYVIPADNPLGPDGGPGPHWAYGLRNAWRISFDSETGRLWAADVGNFCMEEVNVLPDSMDEPANFGWSALEGSSRGQGEVPDGQIPPLFEYTRAEGGCAVIGGYVYRGSAIPDLVGMYLFSDFCRGRIMALETDGISVTRLVDLGVQVEGIASFAELPNGELLVLSQATGVHTLEPDG